MRVHIYQNYFLPSQKALLDPAFIPHDNTDNLNPQYREYPLIRKLYDSQPKDSDYYWGLVSWKFREKSDGVTGQQFIDWMLANPGYDVYYIFPRAENVARFRNPFVESEPHTPGMTKFINTLIRDVLQLDMRPIEHINFPVHNFSYSSHYVGNSTFWDGWISFADRLISSVREHPELNDFMFVQNIEHHEVGKKVRLINYSFVMERLVNLFFFLNPTAYRVKYYPLSLGTDQWSVIVREKEQGIYRDAFHVPRLLRR